MNPLEVVVRVRYMMEYMALCGDPTLFHHASTARPYPEPSGVPMGILTLPDFVVDIALNEIGTGNRGHIEPLDVGGRAGRLAWVLRDFGGQSRGWYSVKYVAKAGEIGRVVLRHRFTKPKPSTLFDPVSLRYILPSTADQDWLHFYGGVGAPVESSHDGLAVTVADVDESAYSLTDLLSGVRFIVVSSKQTDHAIEAIRLIGEGLRRLSSWGEGTHVRQRPPFHIPIGILVDFTALANCDDIQSIIDAIAVLKAGATAFIIEFDALCNENSALIVSNFESVVIREGDVFRCDDVSESVPGVDGDPVARESFTAGYAMASACNVGWKLLREWCRYFPGLRPVDGRPHTSLPNFENTENLDSNCASFLPTLSITPVEPISVSQRLLFGSCLGKAARKTPPSYRDLVKSVIVPNSDNLGALEMLEADFARLEGIGLKNRLAELEQALGGVGLTPRFAGTHSSRTLSMAIPFADVDRIVKSSLLRDARIELGERQAVIDKAVMFDLDATLLDSDGLRTTCWFNGLRVLFHELATPIDAQGIRTATDVYQTFIYKNHEAFLELFRDLPEIPPELQPCDFRQVWNHPYAWGALLFVLDLKPGLARRGKWDHETWAQILEVHRKHRSGSCTCVVCLNLRPRLDAAKKPLHQRRNLAEAILSAMTRFRLAIQAGSTSFWDVSYPCYPQARSTVQMLKAIPGCEVYVVTEGHEETQVRKLTCTGLDDLFPRGRVLSTGAASAALHARNDVQKLLHSNERALNGLKVAGTMLSGEARNDLRPLIENHTAAIGCLTFLRDCLFALSKKAHKKFYAAVIDSIRQDPESPAHVLQELFGNEGTTLGDQISTQGMRFFMVGDRYDNDCKPLLEMFPPRAPGSIGVGTCRLMSGKRALNSDSYPPSGELPTKYVCDTLAQVGHLMHHPDAWKQIDILDGVTPPVLLELMGNTIVYGPTPSGGNLEELASRFKDLCWAREDADLGQEHAVQDTLGQIERDLAVCDEMSLCHLLDSFRNDLGSWWAEVQADAQAEHSTNLVKGALRIFAGVNWWRARLRRPLLSRIRPPQETLEGMLISIILRHAVQATLETNLGVIEWSPYDLPAKIDYGAVVRAVPYSSMALTYLQALRPQLHRAAHATPVLDWIEKAKALPL